MIFSGEIYTPTNKHKKEQSKSSAPDLFIVYLDVDISDLLLYQREVQVDSPEQATTTATEPLDADPVDTLFVSKEIPMYNDRYEEIRDILNRLYPVFDELKKLYDELCSLEDMHKEYMDSIGYDEDEEGEDLAEKLETATSELSSAHLCFEAALDSIDACIPKIE